MISEDAAVRPTGQAAAASTVLDGPGTVRRWGPVAVYALALLVGASLPQSSVPHGVSDGTLHGWGYAGFTLVIARAFARGRWGWTSVPQVLVSMVIAATYGLAMEVYQLFVPGRFFDTRDLLANAIGAVVAGAGVVVATRARELVRRQHSSV